MGLMMARRRAEAAAKKKQEDEKKLKAEKNGPNKHAEKQDSAATRVRR